MSILNEDIDVTAILLGRVIDAIADLSARLNEPAQVTVPPVDLSEIVMAVSSLRPSAMPEELAAAIAAQLAPRNEDALALTLEKISSSLEQIEWASRAPNAVVGGGVMNLPPHMVSNNALMVTDPDVKRGITDFESRLDYAGRTDDQPVYVGRASSGTATSSGVWVVEKVTYDGSDRPTRKQVLTGAWDNRASLSW